MWSSANIRKLPVNINCNCLTIKKEMILIHFYLQRSVWIYLYSLAFSLTCSFLVQLEWQDLFQEVCYATFKIHWFLKVTRAPGSNVNESIQNNIILCFFLSVETEWLYVPDNVQPPELYFDSKKLVTWSRMVDYLEVSFRLEKRHGFLSYVFRSFIEASQICLV